MAGKSQQYATRPIMIALFLALAIVFIVILVSQRSTSTELRSRAANPCEGLVKKDPLKDVSGVVESKTTDSFTWKPSQAASVAPPTLTKTVTVCADTQFRRRFGGGREGSEDPATYEDLVVGDKVAVTGWYADDARLTVYPQLVRVESTARGVETRGVVVDGVTPAGETSFWMQAKDKRGQNYRTRVIYTDLTSCMEKDRTAEFVCSDINVGDQIGVKGTFNTTTKTATGVTEIIRYKTGSGSDDDAQQGPPAITPPSL